MLPRSSLIGGGSYLASTLVHVVAVGGLIWLSTHSRIHEPARIQLPEADAPSLQIILPFAGPEEVIAAPARGAAPLSFSAERRIDSASAVIQVPVEITVDLKIDSVIIEVPILIGTSRRLGVSSGDGRLWELPEAIPIEVGVVFNPLVLAADLDSLIMERLFAFLAIVPPDSFATPDSPEWTREIGGKKYGIDQKWVHLGDIKLPTALLALLPIPQTGNVFQAREARNTQRIREEIVENAERMEDMADIRRYIRELRARREAERAEERDRLVAEQDSLARDSLIP